MKLRFVLIAALAAFVCSSVADVLPPQKLLPKETVLVATVPNATNAWACLSNAPLSRLWRDPAMKAFREKFVAKMTTEMVEPLEHEFGIKFADYQNLAQGQLTFALIPDAQKAHEFSPVLLLDAKQRSGELKTNLAGLKQKWSDAGKTLRTEKIRNVEFTVLVTSSDELSNSWAKAFPPTKGQEKKSTPDSKRNEKVEILFGQVESLLIVSDSVQAAEKIVARQTGSLVPALEEEALFQGDYGKLRAAPGYVWVNAGVFVKEIYATPRKSGAFGISTEEFASAIGLNGLKTLSVSVDVSREGTRAQLFIGVPESERRGLFKFLVPDPLDSAPPGFVPADAIKFNRYRLNIPQSWATLESTLKEFSPTMGAVINFMLQHAGKDKDENYNLKAELLEALGNDLVSFEKAPQADTWMDSDSAPSLFLIGSPKPERLAVAIKVGFSALGAPDTPETKEREFLGRKIYSLPPLGSAPRDTARPISYVAAGGYVAFSSDVSLLEEYIRSLDVQSKALSETAGLAEAAQHVGGMHTGLFGFNNQKERAKIAIEGLRKQGGVGALMDAAMPGSGAAGGQAERIKGWADFSLLPPFESIAKYFHFSVYGASVENRGITITSFTPTPPALK